MLKNWKYVVKDKIKGDIIKGIIPDSSQTAAELCRYFEFHDYEVLSISCLVAVPFVNFVIPERKRKYEYA